MRVKAVVQFADESDSVDFMPLLYLRRNESGAVGIMGG
jgi:hypothetical protein